LPKKKRRDRPEIPPSMLLFVPHVPNETSVRERQGQAGAGRQRILKEPGRLRCSSRISGEMP
jgi:hypothetical protein